MTDEQRATLRERLRETQEKYPDTCYRMEGNDGHYRISGLTGDADGNITAEVVHGRDSYFPGLLVFGIHLTELVPCNCGKLERPTKAQMVETKRKMEGYRDLHRQQKASLN